MATRIEQRLRVGRRAPGGGPARREARASLKDIEELIGRRQENMVVVPRRTFEQLLSLAGLSEPDLEIVSSVLERGPDARLNGAASSLDDEATVSFAKEIYQLRRRRGQHFGEGLFSEPAWDMLLHLYIKGRPISVSSACLGAAAPSTTALRWLKRLEEDGIVLREGDPDDARRSYIRLAPETARKIRKLLKERHVRLRRDS